MTLGLRRLEEAYEIGPEIGRGGMGIVYQGTAAYLGRPVAIKKIYPHLMQEQDLLDRFLQEATVVAQLNHPGLVTIHDLCEDADGIPAIVMERLQGKSLGAILADADSGRLESRRAVHLIAQAAEALDHAHRQGVVHRDIKPDNLMVIEGDRVKIMDFGLACMKQPRQRPKRLRFRTVFDRPDRLFGTAAYMSPEHIDICSVDARSDIYSLGAVLYHALTGRVPFQSNNPLEILAMHINRAPLRPRVLAPDLPEALDLEVMRALEKDPAHRPQSVAEWAIALRRAAGLEASPAGAATGTSARYSPPGNAPTSYLTPVGASATPAPLPPPSGGAASVSAAESLARESSAPSPPSPAAAEISKTPAAPAASSSSAPSPASPPPPQAPQTRARAPSAPASSLSPQAREVLERLRRRRIRTLLRLAVFSLAFSAILVVAAGVIIYKLMHSPRLGRDGQSVVTAPSMPPRTGRAVLVSTETPLPVTNKNSAFAAADSEPPEYTLVNFSNLLIRSGNRLLAKGDWSMAAEMFARARQMNPAAGEAALGLAQALARQGSLSEAQALLRQTLDPASQTDYAPVDRVRAQLWASQPELMTQQPTPGSASGS